MRPGKGLVEKLDSGQVECSLELAADLSPDALAAELKAALGNLKGPAAVGIPSDQLLLRVMTLPTLDFAEMTGMIQLQMDKISPFPEDKMAVTFESLRQTADSTTVLIGAMRRELVDLYGAALQAAGLEADRLDLNALAWWQMLSRSGELLAPGRRLAIVPDGRGGLAIVAQDGMPLAFRPLASVEGLSVEEQAEELSEDIASLLLSLDIEHGEAQLAGIDFWAPGTPEQTVLRSLSETLASPVQAQDVSRLPGVPAGIGERALCAFEPERHGGAAQRRSAPVVADLVPLPWRQVRAARLMRKQLLFASAAFFLLWTVVMSVFLGLMHWRRQNVRAFETEVAEFEQEAADVKELRSRVTGIELHLDRSRSALECLREVTQALPPEISLVSLQYRKGASVIVRGETLTVNLIYDFKDALDKSELFKGVNLGPIQPNQRQHATVQVFQLSANVAGAEE